MHTKRICRFNELMSVYDIRESDEHTVYKYN